MAEPLPPAALLLLLSWLSPAFPVGGFSYSHGLEYAVEAGLVTDRAQTRDWIATLLAQGGPWQDAGLFLAAHRAVRAGDEAALAGTADLARALRATPETALESRAQGRAFVTALAAAWPHPTFERFRPRLGAEPAHAVAVGAATACHGIGEAPALGAYLHAVASALISAAVRLVPLGQTDGLHVLAALAELIPALVERARTRDPDDFGTAAPMADWTSMMHETQYTRLFRS